MKTDYTSNFISYGSNLTLITLIYLNVTAGYNLISVPQRLVSKDTLVYIESNQTQIEIDTVNSVAQSDSVWTDEGIEIIDNNSPIKFNIRALVTREFYSDTLNIKSQVFKEGKLELTVNAYGSSFMTNSTIIYADRGIKASYYLLSFYSRNFINFKIFTIMINLLT